MTSFIHSEIYKPLGWQNGCWFKFAHSKWIKGDCFHRHFFAMNFEQKFLQAHKKPLLNNNAKMSDFCLIQT